MIKRLYCKLCRNRGRLTLISLLYACLFTSMLLLLTFRSSSAEEMDYLNTYIANRIAMVSGNRNIELFVVQDMEKLECVEDYALTTLTTLRFRDQKPFIPDREAFLEYLEEYKQSVREKGMEYDEENMGTAQLIEVNNLLTSHFF